MIIYGQSYFIIIYPHNQENIRIMVFNFFVNAENPLIGKKLRRLQKSIYYIIKIGIQLQLFIVLIGHNREFIQSGVRQFAKLCFLFVQFLPHL